MIATNFYFIFSILVFISSAPSYGWITNPSCSLQRNSQSTIKLYMLEESLSRRDVLVVPHQSLALVMAGILMGSSSSISHASSQARVVEWPGIEYLEPILEFRLSLSALVQASSDTSRYPLLQKRMEKFFGGGLLSERNFYAGLGVQYMGKIQYDKNELKEYIRLDKDMRFNAMENTMTSLNDLLTNLKKDSPDADVVQDSANKAKVFLDQWFALVPAEDVKSAEQLFLNSRKADVNRNGRLDAEELETMSEDDRTIWKKRIDLVGG